MSAQSDDDPGTREAYRELEVLYQRAEEALAAVKTSCRMDGACCRFGTSGLRLYCTRLEAGYLVSVAGPPESAMNGNSCPYQEGNLCGARAGRPLGCRIYFCEEDGGEPSSALSALYEPFHKEIVSIHERHGLAYAYRELLRHPLFSE